MTKKYFLSGHGGWAPEDGYTPLPKGCKAVFYTDFAKCLMTDMEYLILAGTYNKVERVVEEYKMCPNMKLYPQDDGWTTRSSNELAKRADKTDVYLVTVPSEMLLSDVIKDLIGPNDTDVEFHWMACQALGLKSAGGAALGVNACDFIHTPNGKRRFRLDLPNGTQRWV